MKLAINKKNIFLYFLLIPYLYPRGFQSFFDGYKLFFTAWLFLSMSIVLILFVNKVVNGRIRIKSDVISILVYSLLFIVLTLISQGGIHDGLQKLFIVPTMCILCAILMQDRPKEFINSTSNILILNFFLDLTVFNPYLWSNYFNENTHINFIGHVQTASQWGILAVLLSCALYGYGKNTKALTLIILSFATMIVSEAVAAYLVIALATIFFIIYKKMKNMRTIIERVLLTPGNVIYIYILLNLILFYLVSFYSYGDINRIISLLTNGRNYVWREAFLLIKDRFLLGYGAYGALIKVFWSSITSNSNGMNYAHNEVLQQMLNGGLILTISFFTVLYSYIKNINIKKNGLRDYWPYVCVFILMIIMLFDSVTEYYYFFMTLSIIGYWKEINFSSKRKVDK